MPGSGAERRGLLHQDGPLLTAQRGKQRPWGSVQGQPRPTPSPPHCSTARGVGDAQWRQGQELQGRDRRVAGRPVLPQPFWKVRPVVVKSRHCAGHLNLGSPGGRVFTCRSGLAPNASSFSVFPEGSPASLLTSEASGGPKAWGELSWNKRSVFA